MKAQQEATWSSHCYLSSHTAGKNGLGLNRPHHHYQIIQEVLYQQWFRCHGRWCIVGWQIWLLRRMQQHVWWHDHDDTWIDTTDVQWRVWWWWFIYFWINITDFSASYTQVRCRGVLVLKIVASYTRVQLIHEYIQ